MAGAPDVIPPAKRIELLYGAPIGNADKDEIKLYEKSIPKTPVDDEFTNVQFETEPFGNLQFVSIDAAVKPPAKNDDVAIDVELFTNIG